MDKKPNQGSSWNDKNDKTTNPNRRQEEDQNIESPSSGQKASRPDSGSSESQPSDRSERDEQLHGERQADTSRRQRQTEE